jgi:hypothetical protein
MRCNYVSLAKGDASRWPKLRCIVSSGFVARRYDACFRTGMNLVPGLWTMLSSRLLGFADHSGAMLVHLAVGLVISVLGIVELCETLGLDD